MRRILSLLVIAAFVAGCGGMKKTFGLDDKTPAHVSPKSTSIYGSWVLATPADSTAFAGASLVELTLDQGAFTIMATYPARSPVLVRGSAALTETGLLTLVPQSGMEGTLATGALVMVRGQPHSWLASAAGNTMLFASPAGTDTDPSSVWHKKSAAKAAGTLPPATPKP